MKDMMAIFKRDFVARRDLVVLAAAVLFIVLLMPLVPGTSQYSASAVHSLAAQFLALGLGCCVAVGLGISVFGSDLSGGRLGFYFARPVTARAIWVGRSLAALAVVFACEVVVVLPALVTERAHLLQIDPTGWLAIGFGFIFLPVFLFFLAHALSVMDRARTAWLLLDLVGLVACTVGSWLLIRPLYLLGAAWAVCVVGGLLTIAVIAALAIAGFAGLAVGRTDLRRTHGALSLILWFLVGGAVAGLATYSGWLRNFGRAEMIDVEVFSVSPAGDWVEVWGGTPGRLDVRRRVLASVMDDRSVLLPELSVTYPVELVYSTDGGTVIGYELVRRSRGLQSMWRVDLRADDPEIVETTLVASGWTVPALSADGSRVALLEDGTLAVYDLASEQLVAAIRLPEPLRKATLLFETNDRVRLYARYGEGGVQEIRIGEADLSAGAVAETGRLPGVKGSRWMALDAPAERMILASRDDGTLVSSRSLRDARNGELIRELEDIGSPRFLADGRLVSLIEDPDGAARLVVESPDGATRIEHPLADADWEGLGGEALPDRVVVGRLEDLDERGEGRRYDLVDVDNGSVREIADGLRRSHLGFQRLWGGGGMVFWYIDAPESNRIFTDSTGAVVRWDPGNGELVHIVGGRRD